MAESAGTEGKKPVAGVRLSDLAVTPPAGGDSWLPSELVDGLKRAQQEASRFKKAASADDFGLKVARQIEEQRRLIDRFRSSTTSGPTKSIRDDMYEMTRMPQFRMPPNPVLETNKRLGRIEDRFKGMEKIAANAAEIATGVQESANNFLIEFRKAAADNDRTTRRAVKLSRFALAVAIFIPVAQFLYGEFLRAPADAASAQVVVKELKAKITELQAIQEKAAEDLKAAMQRNNSDTHELLANIRDLLAKQKNGPASTEKR